MRFVLLTVGIFAFALSITACGEGRHDVPLSTPDIISSPVVTAEPTPVITPKPTATLAPTPIPTPVFEISTKGTILYFVQRQGSEDIELWRMRPDGSEPALIMAANFILDDTFFINSFVSTIQLGRPFTVSPQGDRFIANIDLDWKVFDFSGNLLFTIPRGAKARDFSWSHDGTSLVYSRGSIFGDHGIYRLDLETGKEVQLLASRAKVLDHSPSLSPAGDKLAFLHHEFGYRWTVAWVDLVESQLPYTGENRFAGSLNPAFHVIVSSQAQVIKNDEAFFFQWVDNSSFIFGSNERDPHVDLEGKNQQERLELANANGIYYVDVSRSTVFKTDMLMSFSLESVSLSHNKDKVLYTNWGSRFLHVMGLHGENDSSKNPDDKYMPITPPRWSPDDTQLVYMSFLNFIVFFDLETSERIVRELAPPRDKIIGVLWLSQEYR